MSQDEETRIIDLSKQVVASCDCPKAGCRHDRLRGRVVAVLRAHGAAVEARVRRETVEDLIAAMTEHGYGHAARFAQRRLALGPAAAPAAQPSAPAALPGTREPCGAWGCPRPAVLTTAQGTPVCIRHASQVPAPTAPAFAKQTWDSVERNAAEAARTIPPQHLAAATSALRDAPSAPVQPPAGEAPLATCGSCGGPARPWIGAAHEGRLWCINANRWVSECGGLCASPPPPPPAPVAPPVPAAEATLTPQQMAALLLQPDTIEEAAKGLVEDPEWDYNGADEVSKDYYRRFARTCLARVARTLWPPPEAQTPAGAAPAPVLGRKLTDPPGTENRITDAPVPVEPEKCPQCGHPLHLGRLCPAEDSPLICGCDHFHKVEPAAAAPVPVETGEACGSCGGRGYVPDEPEKGGSRSCRDCGGTGQRPAPGGGCREPIPEWCATCGDYAGSEPKTCPDCGCTKGLGSPTPRDGGAGTGGGG